MQLNILKLFQMLAKLWPDTATDNLATNDQGDKILPSEQTKATGVSPDIEHENIYISFRKYGFKGLAKGRSENWPTKPNTRSSKNEQEISPNNFSENRQVKISVENKVTETKGNSQKRSVKTLNSEITSEGEHEKPAQQDQGKRSTRLSKREQAKRSSSSLESKLINVSTSSSEIGSVKPSSCSSQTEQVKLTTRSSRSEARKPGPQSPRNDTTMEKPVTRSSRSKSIDDSVSSVECEVTEPLADSQNNVLAQPKTRSSKHDHEEITVSSLNDEVTKPFTRSSANEQQKLNVSFSGDEQIETNKESPKKIQSKGSNSPGSGQTNLNRSLSKSEKIRPSSKSFLNEKTKFTDTSSQEKQTQKRLSSEHIIFESSDEEESSTNLSSRSTKGKLTKPIATTSDSESKLEKVDTSSSAAKREKPNTRSKTSKSKSTTSAPSSEQPESRSSESKWARYNTRSLDDEYPNSTAGPSKSRNTKTTTVSLKEEEPIISSPDDGDIFISESTDDPDMLHDDKTTIAADTDKVALSEHEQTSPTSPSKQKRRNNAKQKQTKRSCKLIHKSFSGTTGIF